MLEMEHRNCSSMQTCIERGPIAHKPVRFYRKRFSQDAVIHNENGVL